MSTPLFLRSLIDLALCESVETLLDDAITLLESHLALRGYIEVWDGAGGRFCAGPLFLTNAVHSTWIGTRYTMGAIRLQVAPSEPGDVELLARQLAPLAERLFTHEGSQRRTIRDEIERVYERRIHEALIRCDWNVTAVARELGVGRMRVIEVVRKLRSRSQSVSGQDS